MSGDSVVRLLARTFIGLFICAVSAGVWADEQDDARKVVDTLHNQLFSVASDSTLGFNQRFEQLTPVVEASYNFEYIGRFILRRSWKGLEPMQREKFLAAFKRLSVANYASRFAEIDERSLVITDVGPGSGERVQVEAHLQTDKHDLPLTYTLQESEDNNWTIVNVVADGVSDLALRRAEYTRVLKDKGFDGLLEHIDNQTADLK